MGRMLKSKITLSLACVALLASGCSKTEKVVQESANGKPGIFDVNMYSLNKLSCDPFGGGGGSVNKGVKATLFYLKDNQPRYNHVLDYIANGHRADNFLFFSTINVPTRGFSSGFPLETGDIIKVDKGNGVMTPLYEYFGIRYSSVVSLGPDDEEGVYELALLSDDGAILKIREGEDYVTAVANDGDHPTKMGCSTYRLNMTRTTQKLIQLDYYQGPRYHISIIPMWRKVQPGQQSPDPSCNVEGNDYYFNEHTSAPRAPYNNLLARGWKPLSAANYNLPESVIFNPCTPGVAPVITNFEVSDNLDGVVVARWTTDIPATSQLRYVDTATGTELMTTADNFLNTEHVVVIEGLKPGTTYLLQGVSISDTYGKSISNPVTLQLR